MPVPDSDGRRVRGDATRARILSFAAETASIEGLEGLSLSQIAGKLQVSKSNVHALFGTMEDLQLATVADARRRFIASVTLPAMEERDGAERLDALVRRWLEYVDAREFPGGCFVVHCAAEYSGRRGPVRDALFAVKDEWLALLRAQVQAGIRRRQFRAATDADQLCFEIDALLVAANNGALAGDTAALQRAGTAIRDRLDRVATQHRTSRTTR